jgi:hypothetical protein
MKLLVVVIEDETEPEDVLMTSATLAYNVEEDVQEYDLTKAMARASLTAMVDRTIAEAKASKERG